MRQEVHFEFYSEGQNLTRLKFIEMEKWKNGINGSCNNVSESLDSKRDMGT